MGEWHLRSEAVDFWTVAERLAAVGFLMVAGYRVIAGVGAEEKYFLRFDSASFDFAFAGIVREYCRIGLLARRIVFLGRLARRI